MRPMYDLDNMDMYILIKYKQRFFTFILYTTVYDIYCTTETILTYLLVHTDHGYGTIILLREGPLTKKYGAHR